MNNVSNINIGINSNVFMNLKNTEVTFITKKVRKEFSVFVSDVWPKQNIIVGWYTNRFGKPDLKQFDMSKYDIKLG